MRRSALHMLTVLALTVASPAAAQTSFDASGGGSFIPANDARPCTSSLEGSMRTSRSADAPTSGLIGHLKLDETSGTTAYEAVGGYPVPRYSGSTTPFGAIGVIGSAAESTSFAVNPYTGPLPAAAITLAGWTKMAALANWHSVVSHDWANFGVPTNTGAWSLHADENGAAFFGLSQAGVQRLAIAPAGTLVPDRWYHLAGTYDGTNLRLYVDGSQAGVLNRPGIPLDTAGFLAIGSSNFGQARVDDIRIYDVALTEGEIERIVEARIEVCSDRTGGFNWGSWGE